MANVLIGLENGAWQLVHQRMIMFIYNKLRKSGQHVEYADINFFKWEIMDHDRDEVLPLLDDLLDKSYDYIIVQLGENISSVANLEGDFRSLLIYLQKSCLKKNILVCSSFFQKDDVDNIKRNVCSRGGNMYPLKIFVVLPHISPVIILK